MQNFSTNLDALIKAKHWTNNDMATRLQELEPPEKNSSITGAVISHYRTGVRIPYGPRQENISKVFGVSLNILNDRILSEEEVQLVADGRGNELTTKITLSNTVPVRLVQSYHTKGQKLEAGPVLPVSINASDDAAINAYRIDASQIDTIPSNSVCVVRAAYNVSRTNKPYVVLTADNRLLARPWFDSKTEKVLGIILQVITNY